MFQQSLDRFETLDLKDVYANSEVSEFIKKNSQTEQNLSIYPNPASDFVYIEIPDNISGNSRLCVYNTLGTLLFSKNVDRSIIVIDVSAFPAGVYKVVITGQVTYSGTIVIE